jgi:hypothetical protein
LRWAIGDMDCSAESGDEPHRLKTFVNSRYLVNRQPILSDSLPEGIDYPLEQLVKLNR